MPVDARHSARSRSRRQRSITFLAGGGGSLDVCICLLAQYLRRQFERKRRRRIVPRRCLLACRLDDLPQIRAKFGHGRSRYGSGHIFARRLAPFEQRRLLDPVLPADLAAEAERLRDVAHVVGAPSGNVGKARDAKRSQMPSQRGVDALDGGEIVRRGVRAPISIFDGAQGIDGFAHEHPRFMHRAVGHLCFA